MHDVDGVHTDGGGSVNLSLGSSVHSPGSTVGLLNDSGGGYGTPTSPGHFEVLMDGDTPRVSVP